MSEITRIIIAELPVYDHAGRPDRLLIEPGERAYFTSRDVNFDGYRSLDHAVASDFGEAGAGVYVGEVIKIHTRKFLGLALAERQHHLVNMSGWKWDIEPPYGTSFFEIVTQYEPHTSSRVYNLNAGYDANEIIAPEFDRPTRKTDRHLRIACWQDTAQTEYRIEMKHVSTRLTNSVVEAAQ